MGRAPRPHHDGPRVPRLRRHGHRAGRGARRRGVHGLRLGAGGQHHRVRGAVRGEQRRRLVGRGPVRVARRWVAAGAGIPSPGRDSRVALGMCESLSRQKLVLAGVRVLIPSSWYFVARSVLVSRLECFLSDPKVPRLSSKVFFFFFYVFCICFYFVLIFPAPETWPGLEASPSADLGPGAAGLGGGVALGGELCGGRPLRRPTARPGCARRPGSFGTDHWVPFWWVFFWVLSVPFPLSPPQCFVYRMFVYYFLFFCSIED